ncbi:deoxyribonuclease II [Ancylostoma duodenale]|uniref:Deoxyribonuclease II n=1 Tax=Ancylostoma duodenale TaxID=51022 RepID=A0A0C2GEK2_9BILA|nr:deoxyribonuclease II [Ancylostoma duodenale]
MDENKGFSFVYFDSTQSGWKKSPELINSTDSAIGATINQIYKSDKKRTFSVAYNDDCPGKDVDSGRGHSKGVALFDDKMGFWMLHSVPNFPPTDKYDYPESGSKYAQSFLCLSLDANFLPDVGEYMRFAQVTPFITNLPKYHEALFVAKHLWHDFIALNLKTDMAVETWRNGAAKDVGSQCGKDINVFDITSVTIMNLGYSSSKDHSKWGVSMKEKVPVVCIGDVNRQESQFKRGGGSVCIEDRKLWKTFYDSIGSYIGCNGSTVQPKKIKEETNN